MSIAKMIAAHPDVREQIGGAFNPTLAQAVEHILNCAAICNSCADACAAEDMDMQQCIRTCLECADICFTTARVAMRRTGENEEVIVSMLETCIDACTTCAAECAKHDIEHCRICAQNCTQCAEDCRAALETVD